jgi:hypothetical protein
VALSHRDKTPMHFQHDCTALVVLMTPLRKCLEHVRKSHGLQVRQQLGNAQGDEVSVSAGWNHEHDFQPFIATVRGWGTAIQER